MMNPIIWKTRLLEVIRRIADERYQCAVWLHGTDERQASSWEESICQLFDDYDIDGFLRNHWQQAQISTTQHAKLAEFRDALEVSLDLFENAPDPAEVLNNPAWHRIRRLAQETLRYFAPVEAR